MLSESHCLYIYILYTRAMLLQLVMVIRSVCNAPCTYIGAFRRVRVLRRKLIRW
jgi:hypothetical protein